MWLNLLLLFPSHNDRVVGPMLNPHPGEPGTLWSRFPSFRLVTESGLTSRIYPICYIRVYLLLDCDPHLAGYFTHSWGLGLQASGHIHTPMGVACRATKSPPRPCDSVLAPRGTRYRLSPRGGYHIGLIVWEAIIGREDWRYRLPFYSKLLSNGVAESEVTSTALQHTHCTHHTAITTDTNSLNIVKRKRFIKKIFQ